jgi:toxin ParE1/3/4
MGSYNIILSENAYRDILDTAVYISKELFDSEAATKLVDEMYRTIASLSEMPERHQLIEDNLYIIPKGMRRIGVKNYSIFYTCSEDDLEVRIWRVVYNKREWQNLL